MSGTLSKIQPLHPPMIPDPSWERAGTTPDGRQLYIERTKRSRAVPLLDEKGERVYAKNPMTAEPLYPRNKPEIYDNVRMFYLHSEGNGNITKIDYAPPSPEQIAAQERDRKIAEMGGGALGAALVDAGLTPDELLARLQQPAAPVSAPIEHNIVGGDDDLSSLLVPDEDFPIQKDTKGKKWVLSNGNEFAGTRDEATAAEAEVAAARLTAAAVPES